MVQGGNLDTRDFKRQILNATNNGSGFLKSLPLQICTRPNSSGAPALTSGVAYNAFDNDSDAVCFSVALPADYDNSASYSSSATGIQSDELYLELYAAMPNTGTGASTLEIDSFKYVRLSNASGATVDTMATTVTLTTAQTGSVAISNSVVTRYRWNLSGLGLRPNDCISVLMGCTVGGSGDAIYVYGAQFLYRTNVKPTNFLTETDSSGNLIRY